MVFAVIITGAIVFDFSRDDTQEPVGTQQEQEASKSISFAYYFSPSKPFSFQTESKVIPKRFSSQIQNKQLENHHSLRAYHLFKAESLEDYSPLITFHYLQFRGCIYISPDDEFAG